MKKLVLFVFAAAHEEDGHDSGQQAEAADDEREEDPRLGVGPVGSGGDGGRDVYAAGGRNSALSG